MRIRVGITIDASPERVWDEVEVIETHTQWMADAVAINFTSRSTRGVGTEFDCLTKVGPLRTTDKMRVTEWKPQQVMGIEHTGFVSGSGHFTLTRKRGGRTQFVWTERLRFPWWMGGFVGEQFARPILRHIWKGNLRRLKARVEGVEPSR